MTVVFQKESLKLLTNATERWQKKVRVHLKVDTGMGRLGAPLNLWPAFLEEMERFPIIGVEGILSHFSMTDEDEGAFTMHQWREFQRAVAMAKKMGIFCKYLHMANSATLTTIPSYSGNLVRPGIMLYG